MATEKLLNTRIQLKYDSLANWNSHSGLVLKKGEVAICAVPANASAVNGDAARPQILFKVGDGESTFANLPWASAKAADVYDWAKQASLPVTKVGTGNVVTNISWDESNKGIKFETASVATSAELETVVTNLTNLTEKVNAMYTNAQIDAAVADAKKAGNDAAADLASYKTTNDSAVADAKKAGTDAAAALEAYKTSNDNAIAGINSDIEDIIDGTTTVKNAENALKATQDAAGNVIANTYETKADASSYKTTNDARVKAVEDSIAAINNAESGILADAKAYADEKDQAMDLRVDALEAIDHSVYAKSAEVVSNSTFDSFKTENTNAINTAEANAKAYADELKDALLGEGIKETFDTLVEIQTWIEGAGINATELTEAIAAEAKARSEADAELQKNIDAEVTARESAVTALGTRVDNVINGTTPVAEATHAAKATSDANGKNIASTYETKEDAAAKLQSAKDYSDANLDTAKDYADDKVSELNTTLAAADQALSSRLEAVEALSNGGVANEAAKVSNALTVKMEDGSSKTFDGSEAVEVDLSNLVTDAQVESAVNAAKTAANSYTDSQVSSEATRAQGVESGLDARLKTVEDNHIKSITADTGLKVTPGTNSAQIAFDDSVVFVFNCGSATELVD